MHPPFLRYFRNTFVLAGISLKVFRANRETGYYHRLVQKIAHETIRASHTLNDGTIGSRVYKKIQWYMVTTLFMGELLADLTGYKLTPRDMETFVYLGAAGGLSDVLTDDYRLDKNRLESLLDPKNADDLTPIEKTFRLYLHNLLSRLNKEQADLMKSYVKKMFHWQAESLSQFDARLSQRQVEEMTLGKGGLFLLLCLAVLPERDKDLQNALFHLGGFIQLMNDTQDMHKDAQEGVCTFVSFLPGYREISAFLEEKRKHCFRLIEKLNYPSADKYRFLLGFHAMYIGILYKLKRYEKATQGRLDLQAIALKDKKMFRVNPFTLRSFFFCYPRIMRFSYRNS